MMWVSAVAFANITYADDGDKLLIVPCTGCHSPVATLPPVFGRPAAELQATMQAMKSGAQPSTLMMRLLRGYTDEDITRLARILASMPGAAQ
ncbi:MAG: hypothetical protein AAF993_17140 [Pseudomonadota bacterium]